MFDITIHIGDKNVTIIAHRIYLVIFVHLDVSLLIIVIPVCFKLSILNYVFMSWERLIIAFTLKLGFRDISKMAKFFVWIR